MSLNDIWDDHVDETTSRAENSASSKDPLFLVESDDENANQPSAHNTSNVDVDIEAMFAEVEAEDDPFTFRPLTSNLDTAALTREAEARHRAALPTLTPHAIMSSSPPRNTGDDQTSQQADRGKGKETAKVRRKPARLDEGRLLGSTGFPKLIKDVKNFKVKGKGHEATDLNRLLQIYGYWTHELYPKTTFRDTVERVEKLCHSKRMHVALSVWRDDFHGLVNGRQPEVDDEIIDLTENAESTEPNRARSSRASSPASDGAAYATSSSHPPSRPPSSASELDDDDFDIDAVIREEELRLERERLGQPKKAAANLNSKENLGQKQPGADDDDTAMWNALDSMEGPASKSESHTVQTTTGDDDAMWDEIDAVQTGPEQISAHVRDEDEDMWDVLQEMEAENAGSENPHPAPVNTSNLDDDWDSVYA
ncbi:hypothetical protein H0H93_004505 [Arthromyces matolae]|nr:hypothetical protein H0H93_004505 [Arthromyces matolae]